MHPTTSTTKSNDRSRRKWPYLVLTLLVIAGLAAFWITRFGDKSRGVAEATTRDSTQSPSTYRNRAQWPRNAGYHPAGAAPGQERPAIRGYVYDMAGAPIEGASVVATTYQIAGNIPTVAGNAQTDERGQFELKLPEGTYQLNARRKGYGPSSVVVRSGEPVSLVLPESGRITGRVYNDRRRPLSHFTIDLISVVPGDLPAPAPVWTKTFDSPDGSFEIDETPAWAVIVRATAADYAPAFSDQILLRPNEKRDVALTLPEGCSLDGTIEYNDGSPAPSVFVDAEARIIAGSMSDASMETANQAQSDDKGRFHLDHVPSGPLIVRGYDGSSAVSTVTVDIGDCNALTPIKLIMSPGGSIHGVARNADGTPLAGAKLTVTARSIGFINTISDAEGRYRFDQIPAGGMRLELYYKGQRTLQFIGVRDGEDLQKDMTLFPEGKGELHGRITAQGKPLAGARLLIAANHGRDKGLGSFYPVTDADGNYRVTNMPQGVYLVSVMSTNAGGGIRVHEGKVETLDLDVAPPPGYGMPAEGQGEAQ